MGARDTAQYVVKQSQYGNGVGCSPKDLEELAVEFLMHDHILEQIGEYAKKLIDGDSVKYTVQRLLRGESL